ncbi:Kinesin-4 [Triticum urartu]|uniref:Kinesin motor domain-containing protein n=2 Tax=Triticum TaxID=4564 RepID=A0A9R0ZI96_TRITD|nr:Kinesin-4 [Triticum urartu]VAI77373.1 unnamed protein product [Triticum turgidum subsp. durum]
MSAVVACLLALRDRFVSHAGEGWTCGLPQNGRMHTVGFPRRENGQVTQNSEVREDVKQMETTLQKVSKSPAMSEPPSVISRPELSSTARHAGRNFHEVFQLRQGGYSDLPSSKISDMMKSTSLDNAPTQSLLSVVNGILDEIIERKNGEIPYHLAFLLRKIILEVERRISTQAEHIRNQNNLMKAREEKYKSRIRVLEALASGTSGQIHVSSNAANGKAHVAAEPVHRMKMEKDKFEEKRQLLEEDQTKLTKDKENVTTLTKDKEDMTRLLNDKEDIIRLMKEKEEMARLIKEKEDTVILKKGKDGDRNQSADEHIAKPIMYKDELISLMKEKENYKVTIMKLKLELEAMKSSCEKSHSLLETKNKDVVNLLKDKENSGNVISQLRQELAMARRSHETYIQDLKTTALQENRNFEQRIKEVELKLEDSTKRERYLEELLEARIQTWEQKEIMLNQFVGLQMQNIQDLRLSSVSIRHEIQNCQKRWSEELSGLGQSLKVLANASEKYHAALEENRKLFNEVQELKGNIRVFCRIRPFLPNEDHKSSTTEITGDNGELILANPTKIGKEGNKLFKFNKVLGPTTSQDEVFRDIQPLVRSVLDGYNVCIFAYGQTGSGKTYTMTGPEDATEEELGVNFRALNDLFLISRNRGDTFNYEVSVQMIEIYNEQIHDLLGSNGGHAKTLMFVQINPDVSSYAESLSTLRFAERVSGVELGAAKANKEGKDIKEFKEQLSLLKDKIAKKDEEINQLQTHSPRVKTGKRADSLLKHSSSSPGISSLGSKMQHRRTASGGKAMGLISRAGSDADNFSEISDRHSETSSMQSIDDIQQQREIMVLSKLPEDDMGPNSADPELASFGYADSEGRLSDISDSGISMGTETDGSISSMVDFALFPEQEKIASTWKEQETAPNTPKDRLPKVTTRVQKATTPKTAPSSSVWPKSRDSTPRSSEYSIDRVNKCRFNARKN